MSDDTLPTFYPDTDNMAAKVLRDKCSFKIAVPIYAFHIARVTVCRLIVDFFFKIFKIDV